MTKVNLTNGDLISLHTILTSLSKEKLPIKFSVARNLKIVTEHLEKFNEEKTKLHEANVMVSEDGEMVIKEEDSEHLSKVLSIAYDWFEYKDEKSRESFFKKLIEITTDSIELDLSCEKLDRSVKVKADNGYETLTLEEVLSDPEANINAEAIGVLMKFELLK